MGRIPQEWTSALDEVAESLLSAAGISRPPVDALVVAERLRIPVVFDGTQLARGRQKQLAGRPTIFLKPDERPERLQWAAAHELGEVVAWEVIGRVYASDIEISPRLREDVANRLASHLLLPSPWFFDDAVRLQADLLKLKSVYRTASHELIALRLLDRSEPTIITIFDQGALTRRESNGPGRPPRLHPVERDCRNEVHRTGRPVEMHEHGLHVQGWPVHELTWQREILRTTPAGDIDN